MPLHFHAAGIDATTYLRYSRFALSLGSQLHQNRHRTIAKKTILQGSPPEESSE